MENQHILLLNQLFLWQFSSWQPVNLPEGMYGINARRLWDVFFFSQAKRYLKKRLWDDPQPEGLLLRKPGAIASSKLTGCELENCHRNP